MSTVAVSAASDRAAQRVRMPAGACVAGVVALFVALAGCTSDPATTTPEVSESEAFTAIVLWEAAQQEPIVDANGNVELPVIYLVAQSGQTIDIGTQADVVEATVDDVVVRFSDETIDSLDEGLDGVPVKDDGVMFVLGDLPKGDAAIVAAALRYRTDDDQTMLLFEIVASDEGAKVIDVVEQGDQID